MGIIMNQYPLGQADDAAAGLGMGTYRRERQGTVRTFQLLYNQQLIILTTDSCSHAQDDWKPVCIIIASYGFS